MEPGTWTDHGVLPLPIHNIKGSDPDYNLIDANLLTNANDTYFHLSFGSYFDGIYQIRLSSPLEIAPIPALTHLAQNETKRPDNPWIPSRGATSSSGMFPAMGGSISYSSRPEHAVGTCCPCLKEKSTKLWFVGLRVALDRRVRMLIKMGEAALKVEGRRYLPAIAASLRQEAKAFTLMRVWVLEEVSYCIITTVSVTPILVEKHISSFPFPFGIA
jgi:hypothetical protein